MRIILLAMVFCATIKANASLNTMKCTGEKPQDAIGTLTLDLDRQIFISSDDTNGFGGETLGLQKLKTKDGNLIYRAKGEEEEFVLTFYISRKTHSARLYQPQTIYD